MRVLIVEDDPFYSRLFSHFCALRGWTVDVSPCCCSALRLRKKVGHDLLLCDIELPEGDGIALAAALSDAQPSLRVIMTSGNPKNLDRARQAGFVHCLPKPFPLEELQTLIDSLGVSRIKDDKSDALLEENS